MNDNAKKQQELRDLLFFSDRCELFKKMLPNLYKSLDKLYKSAMLILRMKAGASGAALAQC